MICTDTYITLTCDGCGRGFGGTYKFVPLAVNALIDAAREYGWEKTDTGHWYCPQCVPVEAIH